MLPVVRGHPRDDPPDRRCTRSSWSRSRWSCSPVAHMGADLPRGGGRPRRDLPVPGVRAVAARALSRRRRRPRRSASTSTRSRYLSLLFPAVAIDALVMAPSAKSALGARRALRRDPSLPSHSHVPLTPPSRSHRPLAPAAHHEIVVRLEDAAGEGASRFIHQRFVRIVPVVADDRHAVRPLGAGPHAVALELAGRVPGQASVGRSARSAVRSNARVYGRAPLNV